MGKQLQHLKKGDKIWFVTSYGTTYLTTTPPRIYEATIDEDTAKQGTLPFPEYCHVRYCCPELNPYHLTSSEFGTSDRGTNGHLFFTDHKECIEYVKDLAKERLKYANEQFEVLRKHMRELKEILIED